MNKKTQKRPDISKYNPVPLYRSYGKTKNESIFAAINEMLVTVISFAFLGICLAFIVIGIVFFIYALQKIGVIIVCFSALLFTYFVILRSFRKRVSFLMKLKRKCRKFGYKIEKKRGILQGLRLNREGFDLIVNSRDMKWYVRFFTPRRHASHITILDKNTIEVKTNLYSNTWKILLKLNKVKVKRYDYSYDDEIYSSGIKTTKVLLVNPVPHDMFKKDRDGAVIPIGTGEKLYDYTIFSGSGFINELQREYEKR